MDFNDSFKKMIVLAVAVVPQTLFEHKLWTSPNGKRFSLCEPVLDADKPPTLKLSAPSVEAQVLLRGKLEAEGVYSEFVCSSFN